MAYSVQSMYHPGVLPDTQGLGPGIAAAGNAIMGALGRYYETGVQDRRLEQAHDWQVERDAAGLAADKEMFGMRMQADESRFNRSQDAQRQEREIEKAMQEEQMRSANLGKAMFLEQSGYDTTALKAAAALKSPKAQAEFLDHAMAQAGMEIKSRAEMAAWQAKQEAARQTFPLIDPTTGKPDPGHFITGNGMALPTAKEPFFTADELKKLGMAPHSVKQNGITFQVPATPKQGLTVPHVKEFDGKPYQWDPVGQTWKPVNVQGAASGLESAFDEALKGF